MKIFLDKELFQWEKNRYIHIEPDMGQNLTFVQFDNANTKDGIVVLIQDNMAKIPDILLKDKLPIMANICEGPKDETRVITRKQLKIIPRSKPESYRDEENDFKEIIYDGGMEV